MSADPDPDPDLDPEGDLPRMTLSEHLDELRTRLIISVVAIVLSMVAAFFFYDELMAFVTAPFYESARLVGIEKARLITIAPGEGFLQVLKLCFLTGFVAVSPVVLWQMWGFVAAGLYKHERRTVRLFFPVSIGLFALGVVAAYRLLIPFGMRFLMGWNVELNFESNFSVADYLSTCLTMVFGMGLIFELPLVMIFLQGAGIVERKTFVAGWRIAVVISFIIGMVLTDPSPVTQLAMAIPVVGLYFMGIWGGRFVGEDAEAFRLWKAWPIALFALAFASMLYFSDELNDLATKMFGGKERPPAVEGTPEPGK